MIVKKTHIHLDFLQKHHQVQVSKKQQMILSFQSDAFIRRISTFILLPRRGGGRGTLSYLNYTGTSGTTGSETGYRFWTKLGDIPCGAQKTCCGQENRHTFLHKV